MVDPHAPTKRDKIPSQNNQDVVKESTIVGLLRPNQVLILVPKHDAVLNQSATAFSQGLLPTTPKDLSDSRSWVKDVHLDNSPPQRALFHPAHSLTKIANEVEPDYPIESDSESDEEMIKKQDQCPVYVSSIDHYRTNIRDRAMFGESEDLWPMLRPALKDVMKPDEIGLANTYDSES